MEEVDKNHEHVLHFRRREKLEIRKRIIALIKNSFKMNLVHKSNVEDGNLHMVVTTLSKLSTPRSTFTSSSLLVFRGDPLTIFFN
jgi:hypothetical protein